MNLRIPGPTPVRPEVLEAVARQMLNHRGPEMAALLERLTEKFRSFLGTRSDAVFLTASGTGGLEAAIVNTLSPGDTVVGVSAGAFGERFCAIAESFGARVERLEVEWGKAADPDVLRRRLAAHPNARAVLLTHNETSTGITHPILELARVVRDGSEALILVDAISSLGAIPLPIDEAGLDIVVTGSQKAWGVPPGLAMLTVSRRGWEAQARARMPRFYFDLARYRGAPGERRFPFTPAMSIFFGLEAALDLIAREGAEAIHARHERLGETVRRGVRSLGLALFADERFASNTVTAVTVPSGVDGSALVRTLRERYDTVVGGGQARLAGRIFRLGHLGFVEEQELDEALRAVAAALGDLGFSATGEDRG